MTDIDGLGLLPRGRRPRPTSKRVLIGMTDQTHRLRVAEALRRAGHQVCAVGDGTKLLETLSATVRFDVVAIEARLLRPSGVQLLAILRRAEWQTTVLLMAEVTDHDARAAATELAAYVITIPFPVSTLCETVTGLSKLRPPRTEEVGALALEVARFSSHKV